MTDLIRDQRRGMEAQRLLAEPLLAEAFEIIEANYRDGWLATKDGQTAERERIWLALTLLTKVRAHLEGIVQGGRVAAHELDLVKDVRDAA